MDYSKQLSFFDDESSTDSIPETEAVLPSVENKISLLALSETSGIGFATIRALYLAYNGNLEHVWSASTNDLCEHLHNASIPQAKQVATDITERTTDIYKTGTTIYNNFKQRGVNIVFRGTPLYPTSLYDLKSPPLWLFVEGDIELLHDPAIVAVVGTREPTENGLNAAKHLSVLLATRGCVILSGLAEGIDQIAHQAAVDYGSPTIAVLGHGIDTVYPTTTANLRQQMIKQGGAVVSEYLPKDTYNRERFVQRNRIQAALAKVIAIVEGKAKSGTAHTLRFSREMHRDSFGVRFGPPLTVPQQEILNDILKYGSPVFALDNPNEHKKLSNYLGSRFPLEIRKRAGKPQLFVGILRDIERLIQSYNVNETDLNWLIEQIKTYRNSIDGNSGNGN